MMYLLENGSIKKPCTRFEALIMLTPLQVKDLFVFEKTGCSDMERSYVLESEEFEQLIVSKMR